MDRHDKTTRRTFLATAVASAATLTFVSEAGALQASSTPQPMTVYRDPGCGCCIAWANLASQSGYRVSIENSANMAALKRRLGVPSTLASCHTAVVGGYVVEGHVPLPAVARLVALSSTDIRGIAVPGMPAGSPGMETPDGYREPFEIIAFHRNGRTSRFG